MQRLRKRRSEGKRHRRAEGRSVAESDVEECR